MDLHAALHGALLVLFRWLHIIPAALVIGGIFFMRIILPMGLATLEPEARQQAFLKCRRGFKMVVHSSIFFLLVSGIYNSMSLWKQYDNNPPMMHSLWGSHVLLALIVIGISLWLLAGKEPPAAHRGWALTNIVLLLALVAVASTLKFARETHSQKTPAKHVAKNKHAE